MSLKILTSLRLRTKVLCGDLLQPNCTSYNGLRFIQKHWNPKFKKLRAAKVIKVELPDFEDLGKPAADLTEEEVRSKLKERGILPEYPYNERQMFISSTGDFFEAYVPPEGDGKVSKITKEGAKQAWELLEKKGKSMLAIRKIRSYDEDFEVKDFLVDAQNIYIKSHELMAAKNKEELEQYVTEKAYPEAIHNIDRKTMHWKFLKSIEPPRVVHARCTNIITKDNYFGQITVRFHSQQVLAVYDRFGRLIYGSEILAKDVLEYVVFEKHLSYRYGVWRVHGKIIPDWKHIPDSSITTYVMKPEETNTVEEPEDASGPKEIPATTSVSKSDHPPLATA